MAKFLESHCVHVSLRLTSQHAEGYYEFDLTMPDERRVVEALVDFSVIEPGVSEAPSIDDCSGKLARRDVQWARIRVAVVVGAGGTSTRNCDIELRF